MTQLGERSIERRHGWHVTAWQDQRGWTRQDSGRYGLDWLTSRWSASVKPDADIVALASKPRSFRSCQSSGITTDLNASSMVSEITRFYCKPDMTSSWFLRQGALHAILYHGFWKRDYDFLIVFHSNVLSGMHGLLDNKVLLQGGYDVIVISPLEGASGNFSWRILKERPWLTDSVPY